MSACQDSALLLRARLLRDRALRLSRGQQCPAFPQAALLGKPARRCTSQARSDSPRTAGDSWALPVEGSDSEGQGEALAPQALGTSGWTEQMSDRLCITSMPTQAVPACVYILH